VKVYLATFLLALADFLALDLSIALAFWVLFDQFLPLKSEFLWFSTIIIALFLYQGLYFNRYDFWHESRLILKTLIFSLFLLLLFFALLQTISNYPSPPISWLILSLFFSAFLLPATKQLLKRSFYHLNLWRIPAKIYGLDPELSYTIFKNPYLGYEKAKNNQAETIFINSAKIPLEKLKEILFHEIQEHHRVIFIPLVNEFDLTHMPVYELTNARTNLISLENRLKNPLYFYLKNTIEYTIIIFSAPLWLSLMGVIAWRIKQEEPKASILFRQTRIGLHGKPFICYKFRTMKPQADLLLQTYLSRHPEEISFYQKYHKYQNDPRITPLGHFLRRTSLDEIPQILNVLKGEMSLVGPRPLVPGEMPKDTPFADLILSVKPGITGLWQVSGRNLLTFEQRTEMDIWYIRNWNLWLDITLYLKTIKILIFPEFVS